MNDMMAMAQISPPDSFECGAAFSMESIDAMLVAETSQTRARFGDLRLYSHFQPIFSLAHQRAIGFEALVRATNGNGRQCTPPEIFATAREESQTVLLDRLCRAVHLNNFMRHKIESSWLFLNINPKVIIEGRQFGSFFREQLERVKIAPQQIVVEILESALPDQGLLEEAVNYYRDLGCLIAIDDFGAGESNFDRIWRLRPDIVKLDKSILTQARLNRNIRSIMPGMVSLLHETGSLVVMEGVESELEAMIAMDSDADFVQGFYFGVPHPTPVKTGEHPPEFGKLFDQFKNLNNTDRTSYHADIAPYINGLGYSSVLLASGQPLEVACNSFLELPRAQFCFLLDADGRQIGNNVYAPHVNLGSADPRYAPLSDARGANWSRRHYFRRAISKPEKVHVTRPYLSVTRATPCLTTSIAFKLNGELRVLCGDLGWDSRHSAIDRTIEIRR
ncbi:MAG TPA: EAL domain-containing protein [Burkholderiales bacterium]|nr:EAL domain-containing protein [Burkholderiales bacterium]